MNSFANPVILLAHFPKLTYRRFKKIISHPTLIANLADAEPGDFIKIGWEESAARDIIAWRKTVEVQKIYDCLLRENITVITADEPSFPPLLKEIADPPAALFVRGKIPTGGELLAIVGTRKTTPYGKQVTMEFSSALAERGIILVSGLALGTDSFVHEASLQYHTPTIAVLGSGVDRQSVYPRAHDSLAERILKQGGALISEYPPGFTPTPYSFPARNRIIAGLCRATLVTEAPHGSGALITARAALDYNREVAAIPHPITSAAGKGSNFLLKQGAHVALQPTDILEILNIEILEPTHKETELTGLNETENLLLKLLSTEPLPIDRISKDSGLLPSLVASTLLMLEMKGCIKNIGAQRYARRHTLPS